MSAEKPVLGIDTSGSACAAALVCGGQAVAQRNEPRDKGRVERLFPMMFEIMSEAGCDWRDLKALAVVTGPGNHTGIRLAVSAARGLSLSLGIPAVGVSAFAAACLGVDQPCLVMVEAPRGRAHAKMIPGGEPEFNNLADLPRPACGTTVIAGEFAREAVLSWGRERQQPRWPPAEAAARIASSADISNAEPPVPHRHSLRIGAAA